MKKLIVSSCVGLCLVANSAFADDKSCALAQQLLKDIDNEAGLYYSQDNYQFNNDVLAGDLKALSSAIELPALDSALSQLTTSITENKGVDSALADVAMAVYDWEGDKCF